MAGIAAEAHRRGEDSGTADGPAPGNRPGDAGPRSDRFAEREAAFIRTYDELADSVYAFFAYRVRDRADAEDLTQTAFERALNSWHRFDPARSEPITWLMAIARNLLVDRHRREQARPVRLVADLSTLDGAVAYSPSVEEGALGVDPALESALARLSDRERELLALRFGAGMSGPQIAEVTGLSVANVQQIMSRSMRRLREELGDRP